MTSSASDHGSTASLQRRQRSAWRGCGRPRAGPSSSGRISCRRRARRRRLRPRHRGGGTLPAGPLPISICAPEVMAISARSTAVEQRGVRRRSSTKSVGFASRLEPISFAARREFERAGDDAAEIAHALPGLQQRLVLPLGGRLGEAMEMHGVVRAVTRGPGLFHREAEKRREPGDEMIEQRIDGRCARRGGACSTSCRSRGRPCGCRNRTPRDRWWRN